MKGKGKSKIIIIHSLFFGSRGKYNWGSGVKGGGAAGFIFFLFFFVIGEFHYLHLSTLGGNPGRGQD